MKKGLTQTLLTVAIALLGYQALAMAPVITDIPSPVIGNKDVTAPNVYVWPDAIALDNYVSDDNVAKGNIKWYYRVESPAHYMLNGVRSLSSTEAAATDATTLPDAARIDNQVLQSELNLDSNTRTVTIRNNFLSPLDGSAGGSVTGDDSEIITLYASDGTTYSTKPVMFYTEINGTDHLKSDVTPPFYHCTWENTMEGWRYAPITGANSATSSNHAICFSVGTPGAAMAEWISPTGVFTVEQNAVYKIRGNLNSSLTTKGHTPFWDIYVNNYDSTGKGLNLFGGDLFILDNGPSGSADSVISSVNGQDFQLWFAPLCTGTDQWNNGYAANSSGDNLKVFLSFRMMDLRPDLGSSTTVNSTLCLTDLDITKYPPSSMTTIGSPVYSLSNNLAPNTGSNGNLEVSKFQTDTTVNFASGALTITPGANGSGSAGVELCDVKPATDTNYHLGTNDIGDNFPVAWESDTLYMVTWNLAAPSSTAEASPWNVFWIGVDTPSNEVLTESFVTNFGANKFAMPKYNGGTAQTYKTFWYSHTASTAGTSFYDHFRPRLTLANKGNLMNGGTNNGGIKVTGCSVQKVAFQ